MINKKTLTKQITIPLAALALALSAGGGIITAAHADTTTAATTQTAPSGQGDHGRPAAMGTVTAISGDIITLTDSHTNTTYSVDATNATVTKHAAPTSGSTPTAPTTISVSDIAVGDTLMVQGTVNGTSITATRIDDGQFGGRMGGHGQGVHGTVTAVNGTTLTVQGANGTTYTVDGAASTASKVSTISVADINVGDEVGIDGTVTGSTVTAKNIMDGIPAKADATNTNASS